MARILVEYSATDVRLFFRVFFFVVFILISFFGNQCLATRAKLRLIRGRTVPLPLMSSWLGSFDALLALKSIRTFPGGWLGFLMIVAYLLNLGTDLTSALIQSVPVHDRCKFGTGLVVSGASINKVPWNGAPYTVVSQAQVTSLLNDGFQGVYKKSNRDLNFSADATDVVGEWQCTRNPTELEYSADVSVDDIVTSLLQHDLLYGNPFSVSAGLGNTSSHLVILDSSVGANIDTVFDVRFSVDTTAYGNETKHMQSYQCVLNDTYGELEQVQRGINSLVTLNDWAQVFQGAVYDGTGTPASSNTGAILEQILNSMTMIAGGSNYLLDNSQANGTQGCITRRTHILWELLLLSGLTLMILVFLGLFWVGMGVRLKILSGRARHAEATWIQKYTPTGNFEWMAQAVREYRRPQTMDMDTSKLKDWCFGQSANEEGYGIIGRRGSRSVAEETVSLRSSPAI